MSIFRIRFQVEGDHVHCTLYAAPERNLPWAKCGDFVVRKGEEFESLVASFAGADFIGQNPGVGIVEASKRSTV